MYFENLIIVYTQTLEAHSKYCVIELINLNVIHKCGKHVRYTVVELPSLEDILITLNLRLRCMVSAV